MKLILKVFAVATLIFAIIVAGSEKSTAEKVGEKIKDVKEAINKKAEDIKEEFIHTVHEADDTITGWKDMATDKLVEMKEKIMGVPPPPPTYKEKLAQKATYVKDWIGSMFSHLIPNINTTVDIDRMQDKISEKYEQIKDTLTKKAGDVKEDVKDVGKKVENLKPNEKIKDIKEKVHEGISGASEYVSDKYKEIKGEEAPTHDRIYSYVSFIVDNIKNMTDVQRNKIIELIYGNEEYQRLKESVNYIHEHRHNLTDAQRSKLEQTIKEAKK